jgi:hypothetical protein
MLEDVMEVGSDVKHAAQRVGDEINDRTESALDKAESALREAEAKADARRKEGHHKGQEMGDRASKKVRPIVLQCKIYSRRTVGKGGQGSVGLKGLACRRQGRKMHKRLDTGPGGRTLGQVEGHWARWKDTGPGGRTLGQVEGHWAWWKDTGPGGRTLGQMEGAALHSAEGWAHWATQNGVQQGGLQ